MSSKTRPQDITAFEDMMQDEFEENPVSKSRKAIIIAIIATLAVTATAIAFLISGLTTSSNAKHARMESLAQTVSVGQDWNETSSESPAENSRGYLIKEWKTTKTANLDDLAGKLGISMDAVAYPAGCKEGTNGEFIVRLCNKPDNQTIKLVIG